MKNLFVFWDEPLNPVGGGIHRCIINLITFMPQRGYNVKYIYSKDFYQTFNYETEEGKIQNIPLKDLGSFLKEQHCDVVLGQEAVFSSTFTKAFSSISMVDIKFVNQYHNTPLYFQKKLTWDYLKFEWITTHSLKSRLALIARGLFYPLWRWNVKRNQNIIYKYNYDNSDVTLLLSEHEKPHLKKMIGEKDLKKCVVIPNPLSWPEIVSTDILKDKQKEVLIVSRIYNSEKRIDLALKVWRILQDRQLNDGWTMRIVGEGIHEAYLKEMTHALGLKNVIWEGRREPLPFYKRASIFLLTSVVEGWALTLTESMQTGVVPIAFDSYPAVRSIITDGYDGFIVPTKNLEILSDRISKLMHDSDTRERMALNGLRSCRRFEVNKIMDQWQNMLDNITNK